MAHLTPRSTTVVLYQGDDMDRLAELRRKAAVAERIAEQEKAEDGSARFGDTDPAETVQRVKDAQREFDAFVDEAAGRALTVELRSIGRRRFRDLVVEHPPRMVKSEAEDGTAAEAEHEDDAGYGVNTESFARALLCYRDGETVTIAQPEFGSRADVERFVDDELAEGDYDQLFQTAYFLNRSPSRDPKALRYTLDSPSSDET